MGLINLTQHTLERIIKNIRDRIQDVTPFVGTQSEWNALSSSEKAKYKIVHLTGNGTYKRDATTGDLVSIAGSGGSTQTMTGATSSTDGVGGSTPTPLAGDQGKFLKGNAEWSIPNLSSDVTGTLPAANGGTGNTSLQATRNAMGLGNTTGALPVANGGTGQTTLALARNAMGLGNTLGALPIANGGTGATTAANARDTLVVPYANYSGTAATNIFGTSYISNQKTYTTPANGYLAGTCHCGASGGEWIIKINSNIVCSAWNGTSVVERFPISPIYVKKGTVITMEGNNYNPTGVNFIKQ